MGLPISLFSFNDTSTADIIPRSSTLFLSAALRDACLQVLDAGRGAIIDLGACTMLDSTVLGTLHELVTRTQPCTWLRVQNVPEGIRRLFVELAMNQVTSSIVDHAQSLPAGMTVLHARGDPRAHGFLLHAHELLAELSPHNAEQFSPVIEALRRE
jgi:anti-anti-sigma regulatory factor